MGGCSIFKPLIIALIFMVCMNNLAKAQVVLPCLDKLSPCDNYLSSTTNAPAACCNAILETAKNQLPCLCELFSTPLIFETAGVNFTGAIQLTLHCGVTTDLTNCTGLGATSTDKGEDPLPCANKLDVCVPYLGSPNPSVTCCNVIQDTAATQLPCLCKLFSVPEAFESAGLNYTEAVQLTHRCGINTDVTTCKDVDSKSLGNNQGGVGKGNDRGDSSKVTWTGLYFLLLFWASMLFN